MVFDQKKVMKLFAPPPYKAKRTKWPNANPDEIFFSYWLPPILSVLFSIPIFCMVPIIFVLSQVNENLFINASTDVQKPVSVPVAVLRSLVRGQVQVNRFLANMEANPQQAGPLPTNRNYDEETILGSCPFRDL